ncbi:hypothetical protein P8452_56675 [Trifolium repens]|nr:hypothetical protein P8452_56675 [Trifolium repens]
MLNITYKAKSEIVQKVCDIVKKQLVVSDDSNDIGESKFTTLVKYFRDTTKKITGWNKLSHEVSVVIVLEMHIMEHVD